MGLPVPVEVTRILPKFHQTRRKITQRATEVVTIVTDTNKHNIRIIIKVHHRNPTTGLYIATCRRTEVVGVMEAYQQHRLLK